jgi:hypothetical protein
MISRCLTSKPPTTCTFCGQLFNMHDDRVYAWQSTSGKLYCSEFCANDEDMLSNALQKEVGRVRDVLMPTYQSMGRAGSFVLAIMCADLDRAAEAMIEGDPVAMHRVYEILRGYKE